MNTVFWIAQGLLAVIFAMAGSLKVFAQEKAREQMAFVRDYSPDLTRLVGIAELLGAVGVILPAVTGILPWLTPLAAVGFGLIQLLAIFVVHIPRKEFQALPLNMVLLALSVFVAFGRWDLLPF